LVTTGTLGPTADFAAVGGAGAPVRQRDARNYPE